MLITREVYDSIYASIGSRPAETGGVLFKEHGSDIVLGYLFDIASAKTMQSAVYVPNTGFLNLKLGEFERDGFQFHGIIHSHPHGITCPSSPDIQAALSNLRSNPHIQRYLLPIVQTIPTSGHFEIHPYVVDRRGNVQKEVLQVMDNLGSARNSRNHSGGVNLVNPFGSEQVNPFGD